MTQPAEAGTLSGTLMDTTQTQALFCGCMAGTPQPLSPSLRALRTAHEPLPMVTHNIPARGTTADYRPMTAATRSNCFASVPNASKIEQSPPPRTRPVSSTRAGLQRYGTDMRLTHHVVAWRVNASKAFVDGVAYLVNGCCHIDLVRCVEDSCEAVVAVVVHRAQAQVSLVILTHSCQSQSLCHDQTNTRGG